MTNRTASLLPCVAVAALAGAAAATIEFKPASAADECLAKPGGTPAGKHWFYRVDRTTKKQCWYLREDDRASQGASLVTRKLASHRDRTTMSSSAADARAEIQSSPSGDDTKTASAVPSSGARTAAVFPPVAAFPTVPAAATAPAAAKTPTSPEPLSSAPAVDTSDSATSDSAVATRWPDSSGTLQTQPAPARAPTLTLAAAASDAAPADVAPVVASQPTADVAPLTSVGGLPDNAARTRLFAFLGAVAVAGFSTSVLLARARAKRQLRIEPAAARYVSRWPTEPELDRMHLPRVDDFHAAAAARRERAAQLSVVPRDDARYDEQYEVEDLLARYSGQGRSRS
ncbi:conserved hypothetical protein; putative signal peptide [Bradyrhizobium sp. ORS 278]|uniref:hypothetical protein n=1 Tax=Bradyrhizobium sp. (strain ORS 278) TaxID=114615 RepID=UPI00015076CB|nr:hypothetical protein [Bradyrhizobium sp. ORS 278]CAL75866.1 conserved hypothetical protein; putative signal peptide [Bradyrhizobium sp. ORS 278]